MKKIIEKIPENKKSMIEKSEKIINIVDNILYFNHAEQGLKILTPNQILSRLPITLAQLNTGNNSEKFKNKIVFFIQLFNQLLHSLERSKKLTKQLYKSLIDII